MAGLLDELQRLLPVLQGPCGAQRMHQQPPDLHPEGVPAGPQDSPPLLAGGATPAGTALRGGGGAVGVNRAEDPN